MSDKSNAMTLCQTSGSGFLRSPPEYCEYRVTHLYIDALAMRLSANAGSRRRRDPAIFRRHHQRPRRRSLRWAGLRLSDITPARLAFDAGARLPRPILPGRASPTVGFVLTSGDDAGISWLETGSGGASHGWLLRENCVTPDLGAARGRQRWATGWCQICRSSTSSIPSRVCPLRLAVLPCQPLQFQISTKSN